VVDRVCEDGIVTYVSCVYIGDAEMKNRGNRL